MLKSTEVTVMSFNIHYGADGDDRFDLERAAAVIENSGAGIVGLQEVDRQWGPRSEFRDEAAWLAERLNMHFVFGANLEEPPLPGHVAGRQYGNAILSAFPILSAKNHLFENRTNPLHAPQQPTEQRGLLEAVVDVHSGRICFYNTHLDFHPVEERAHQVREVAGIAGRSRLPAIIVGDLNAVPDAPELQPLFLAFTDAFAALGQNEDYTFAAGTEANSGTEAGNPHLRIDYILTSSGVAAGDARVISTRASDHLPIIATVALPRTGGS